MMGGEKKLLSFFHTKSEGWELPSQSRYGAILGPAFPSACVLAWDTLALNSTVWLLLSGPSEREPGKNVPVENGAAWVSPVIPLTAMRRMLGKRGETGLGEAVYPDRATGIEGCRSLGSGVTFCPMVRWRLRTELCRSSVTCSVCPFGERWGANDTPRRSTSSAPRSLQTTELGLARLPLESFFPLPLGIRFLCLIIGVFF